MATWTGYRAVTASAAAGVLLALTSIAAQAGFDRYDVVVVDERPGLYGHHMSLNRAGQVAYWHESGGNFTLHVRQPNGRNDVVYSARIAAAVGERIEPAIGMCGPRMALSDSGLVALEVGFYAATDPIDRPSVCGVIVIHPTDGIVAEIRNFTPGSGLSDAGAMVGLSRAFTSGFMTITDGKSENTIAPQTYVPNAYDFPAYAINSRGVAAAHFRIRDCFSYIDGWGILRFDPAATPSVWTQIVEPTFGLCSPPPTSSLHAIAPNDAGAVAMLFSRTGYAATLDRSSVRIAHADGSVDRVATAGVGRYADVSNFLAPSASSNWPRSPTVNNFNRVLFGAARNAVSIFSIDTVYVADASGHGPRTVITDVPGTPSDLRIGGRAANLLVRADAFGWPVRAFNDAGQILLAGSYRYLDEGIFRTGYLLATPRPGLEPGRPILPKPEDMLPGGGYRFAGPCNLGVDTPDVSGCPFPISFDPPPAIGFEYTMAEGSTTRFGSVLVPVALEGGDADFKVEFEGKSFPLKAGKAFFFTAHAPAGVQRFRITGIDPAEEIDPSQPGAFVTTLTFVDNGSAAYDFTMVPISADTSPLASFTLKRSLIAGCRSVSGTVTLSEPAPVGGTVVSISDTLDAATTPLTLTFKQGVSSRSFSVRSSAVASPESGTVNVSLDGKTLSQPLTLRPMGLQSVTLAQKAVVGGAEVAGTAKLECAAGPDPIEVSLSSSLPEVATVSPAMLTIPAGETTAAFTVTTVPVLATAKPKIVGTANGITKSRTLTVTTPVLVTPTSLKFGLVPIGTSPALSTTLSNRGDAPFAVSSIVLSGSNARFYAVVHDCPAALAPGAACTIEVTFTPADTRSRSAKLVIGTDVANPVGVALSGKGVTPP